MQTKDNRKQGSLISLLFFSLINLSPGLKRKLWKYWYNLLARHDDNLLLATMNYGYIDDLVEPASAPLTKPQLALYDHVLKQVVVDNKIIVEVGSGRGGGALYLTKKHDPSHYLGVDLACDASVNSVSRDDGSCLYFITGDAMSLPIQAGSVDIVINVESSHCYADLEQFIKQVSMMLVDGGYFCYCDLMPLNKQELLKTYIADHGMEILESKDITKNVMRSLDSCTQDHTSKIQDKVPWFLRNAFSDFAGIKDTGVYNLFKSGKYSYHSFLIKKKKREMI